MNMLDKYSKQLEHEWKTAIRMDSEASRKMTAEEQGNELDASHKILTGMSIPRYNELGDELSLPERLLLLFFKGFKR